MGTAKEILYDWAGANLWIFKQINALSGKGHVYDQAMQTISNLSDGKHVFIPYLVTLCVLAVISGLVGIITKRHGNKFAFNQWIAIIALFAVAFPVNAAINSTLKNYFSFPRPYVAIEESQVQKLENRGNEDGHRSFPSGHVAFITCLVFCLWGKLSDSARPIAALSVFMVAWSRIALGMHFPADLIGSFFITLAVASMVRIAVFYVLHNLLGLRW